MICIKWQLYQFLQLVIQCLEKNILKMTPPSIQKLDQEDTGKLVATVTAAEMTREYLIKQKILPDHINV